MNKIKLVDCIKEILNEVDLKSISAKGIRIKLQEKLNQDFTNNKSEIDKIILKLYNEKLKNSDVNYNESSSVDDDNNEIKEKNKMSAIHKKSLNYRDGKYLSTEKNNESEKDKMVESAENESCESYNVNNDNDAEIARALQAEINGMRHVRKKSRMTKKASKNKEENITKRTKGDGKILNLSSNLSRYLGTDKMSYNNVRKRFWEIAREKNMFDPSNRQFVLCDDEWQQLFSKKRIRMFAISKYLEKHFIRD